MFYKRSILSHRKPARCQTLQKWSEAQFDALMHKSIYIQIWKYVHLLPIMSLSNDVIGFLNVSAKMKRKLLFFRWFHVLKPFIWHFWDLLWPDVRLGCCISVPLRSVWQCVSKTAEDVLLPSGLLPWNATPGKACGMTLSNVCRTREVSRASGQSVISCLAASPPRSSLKSSPEMEPTSNASAEPGGVTALTLWILSFFAVFPDLWSLHRCLCWSRDHIIGPGEYKSQKRAKSSRTVSHVTQWRSSRRWKRIWTLCELWVQLCPSRMSPVVVKTAFCAFFQCSVVFFHWITVS